MNHKILSLVLGQSTLTISIIRGPFAPLLTTTNFQVEPASEQIVSFFIYDYPRFQARRWISDEKRGIRGYTLATRWDTENALLSSSIDRMEVFIILGLMRTYKYQFIPPHLDSCFLPFLQGSFLDISFQQPYIILIPVFRPVIDPMTRTKS